MSDALKSLSTRLVELAMKKGAIDADAIAISSTSESVRVRNGKVESIEREDARGVGLRAFTETRNGPAFATASSSDVSEAGLEKLADQVIAMARISEADPDAVPPSGAEHPTQEELDAWRKKHSPKELSWNTEAAKSAAKACEDAAISYSSRITNSEGAEAGFGSSSVAYACSDGFAAGYQKTSASLSASVIAGSGNDMQRDYAWHSASDPGRLNPPEEIGREAAMRATRRLGAKGIEGRKMTVIFEPRTAISLLGHLTSAINGLAILQERSFLGGSLNEKIFPDLVSVMDDPDHPQGMGNRLFDGEGTRCRRIQIIGQGVLKTYLTNRYVARRLGCKSTGHAKRGLAGDIGIGTSNLVMSPGDQSLQEMLQSIGDGLLVTELMGFGVNGVTGDYSRGAAGFLIEKGEATQSVQGITIAGNLRQMFANVSHIGNDVTWFGSIAAPSLAIAHMTVAGE
jgi:PmbA protein